MKNTWNESLPCATSSNVGVIWRQMFCQKLYSQRLHTSPQVFLKVFSFKLQSHILLLINYLNSVTKLFLFKFKKKKNKFSVQICLSQFSSFKRSYMIFYITQKFQKGFQKVHHKRIFMTNALWLTRRESKNFECIWWAKKA